MKVKMKTLSQGPDGKIVPGQVIDVSPDQAKALIDGGFADLDERQAPESAAVEPSENTAMPSPERREVSASNVAAKLAEEHDIDLAEVEGTGAGGKIIKSDMEKVIADLEGDDEE